MEKKRILSLLLSAALSVSCMTFPVKSTGKGKGSVGTNAVAVTESNSSITTTIAGGGTFALLTSTYEVEVGKTVNIAKCGTAIPNSWKLDKDGIISPDNTGLKILGVSEGTAVITYSSNGVTSKATVNVKGGSAATTTTDTNDQKHYLTIEDMLDLSEKGNDLTWSDFEGYEHTDVGSGLYIWELDIQDCNCKLHIGGGSLEEKPSYIRLTTWTGVVLDIRTDDLTPWFYNSGGDTITTSVTTAPSVTTTTTTTEEPEI